MNPARLDRGNALRYRDALAAGAVSRLCACVVDRGVADSMVARALELTEREPRRDEGKKALDRAKLLYESGHLDDAASVLERLAAKDSSNVDIRGYLGFEQLPALR